MSARGPLRGRSRLNDQQVGWVAAFLRSLTDPCVESRECLAPWIVDDGGQALFPDDNPLIAEDSSGSAL